MTPWRSFGYGLSVVAALAALPQPRIFAQYTPVFFDGYAVSADTLNLNFETATRQSGVLAPIDYVAITPDVANDYHHQLFTAETSPNQPLQLAEDGLNATAPPVFSFATMVSPDFDFSGSRAEGIVGKRITFDLDVGAIVNEGAGIGKFVTAGITLGASTTLVDSDNQREIVGDGPATPFFSVRFIEDTFNGGNDNFIQVFDGLDAITFRQNHPGGSDPLSVQLDVTDPSDGDPWDGVGSTVIDILINGEHVFSYEKGDGGYGDNYITLWGNRNFAGNTLATHTFDNFTVYAAPAVIVAENADFNGDQVVDGLDLLLLQRGLGIDDGSAALADGDANGDGNVNAADASIWEAQFGSVAGSALAAAVPEPSAWTLACGAGLLLGRRRGKRRY
jgi:hypothetical protein